MAAILSLLAVTAAAFVATNLDNLLLLTTLHARYRQRPGAVTAGYLAGMLIVFGIAFASAKLAEAIPLRYLGFLGVVPVVLGIAGVVRQRGAGERVEEVVRPDNGGSGLAATLLTQLGNGADTVVTFGVLFADTVDRGELYVAAGIGGMLVAFAATARYATGHPVVAAYLDRYGRRVTPWILIAVGGYIVANTALDVMPG